MDITVQNMVKIFEGTLRHNLTAYATGQPVESFKVDYFEGEPGVGKTSGVRQAAANIANDESFLADIAKQTGENPDFRARTFIAAQYEAVDIGGAPWVIEKENTIVMERSRPAIFPENGFGMIFCDELSKAKTSVLNVMGQAMLEHRVGEHRIAPGYTLVAAGNRRQDRSGDNELPRFLLDRMSVYNVVASKQDWIDYAIRHEVDPAVIWFVKSNDEWFQKFDPASKVNPTARSWEKVSDYIRSGFWTGSAMRATIEGTVGGQAGHAFYAFWSLRDKLPDPEKVLADPDNAPIPADPQARYALMAALSSCVNNKNIDGFNKYLKRFDAEVENGREIAVLSVSILKARDKLVFMTPAGMNIMERYSELVLA